MNISNSALFKEFARPILQPGNNIDEKRGVRSSPGIMDSIMRYLLKRSHVEVQRVKISHPTEDTYNMSIDCRVTRTGPVSSNVSAMDLDLMFDGFVFGRLRLPKIRTSYWGAKVMVENQTIEIIDLPTYKMFVRSVILNDETSFQLEHGNCTISAMGLTNHCDFNLDLSMGGMGGLPVTLKKLHRDGDSITTIFEFNNTSPVEIDHGLCKFDMVNDRGQTLATLEGDFKLVHGKSKVTFQGTVCEGAMPSDKVRLMGVGTDQLTWCNETIKFIDSVFDMDERFADALLDG